MKLYCFSLQLLLFRQRQTIFAKELKLSLSAPKVDLIGSKRFLIQRVVRVAACATHFYCQDITMSWSVKVLMVKQSFFASSYLAQPFAKGPPGQMEYPVANMGCFRGYSK
jgi:hypothetical protein